MKIIGLIGGMSWESTVPYYRQINETIRERLGGLHSARLILYSVDFHDIERLQHAGDWQAAGVLLAEAARALQAAGASSPCSAGPQVRRIQIRRTRARKRLCRTDTVARFSQLAEPNHLRFSGPSFR